MNKSFEYCYTVKAEDSLEVEDIGNTCIHILNDLGYEWYLIVETYLGEVKIKEIGPFLVSNSNKFYDNFYFRCSRFDYSESKISLNIDRFINDDRKLITQAEVCEKEEAYKKLNNINFEEM